MTNHGIPRYCIGHLLIGAQPYPKDAEAARLCDDLLLLMERSQADWTLTWRNLALVAEEPEMGVKMGSVAKMCCLMMKHESGWWFG